MKPKLSVAKPLIAMAICVCSAVLAIMTCINNMCGPGSGFNGSGAPSSAYIFGRDLLIASCLAGVGFFIWFIVVMVLNYQRD